MSQPRDYYEILGIARTAGADEIKKAYRKLALQHHPDRNPDDASAEAKFKEASEAYSVLSDANQRATYDRFGHAGLRGAGMDPGFQNADEIFSHFSDLFGDLFGFGGGGGRGRGRGGPRLRRGADLEYALELDFLEAVHGCSKEVEIARQSRCDTCGGSGAKEGTKPITCSTCNGIGEVVQAQMFLRIRTACPTCGGSGTRITDPCPTCRGAGRTRSTDKLTITVPPGVSSGLQLRLTGKGDQGDQGAPAGDLYVLLRVGEHETFRRDGADILAALPVSYPQACLGASLKIQTVHGEETLELPKGTPSGKVFKLRGKGAPVIGRQGVFGDHHVQVVVAVPGTLSGEEEELIRKLAALQDHKVSDKGFWRDILGRLTS
jgi:molecular chaperone DnaJ